MRKGYHLLAISLFLPALLLEPQLLGVALTGALAVLLALEVLRLSGLPGVGEPNCWASCAGQAASRARRGISSGAPTCKL